MTVFAKYKRQAWPYVFAAEILVHRLVGGIPSDPTVAKGWLKARLTNDDDKLLMDAVAEVMTERGVPLDQAVDEFIKMKHLSGFKRERCPECPPSGGPCESGTHGLYIEGRQVKACLKEAANIRWPYPFVWSFMSGLRKAGGEDSRGQGRGKTSESFFAEYVQVTEDHLDLGVTAASGINQSFIKKLDRGRPTTALQYEEYADDVKLAFTVESAYDFTEEQWAMVWLTAEQQGVGASRSQGYGRFEVTRWERLP